MRRSLFGLLVAPLLVLPLHGAGARAAAPHARARAQRLLYTWTFPKRGSLGSWLLTGGQLTYSGESIGSVYPRFTLKNTPNFAVEARIQGLAPGGPQATLTGFGITVRARRNDPHSAVSGGSFFSSSSEDNNPELYWNGDTVGGAAFAPGTASHLYRLESSGGQYTLSIDGKTMVSYPIRDYPDPPYVGIFSMYYKIQVQSFRVLALPAPSGPAPALPPTKPFVLTVTDLPTTTFYAADVKHFYPNEETARERGVSLSSLQQSGRLVSYGVDFYAQGKDLVDIYNSVTAFSSPANARADIDARLQNLRRQFSSFHNYTELPPNQVGDTSAGIRFDASSGGYNFTVTALVFARGSYEGLLEISVDGGSITNDALSTLQQQLAKTVDGRIQGATS